MGKIGRTTINQLMNFLAGLIGGVLIGSILLVLVVSYRMDQYHKKIIFLENIIEDKEIKLEKLEDNKESHHIFLQDIEVYLDFQGDEIDKIDIQKAVKEKYLSLLGKDIRDMDGNILAEVVNKRIFKIDEREYRLQVEKLILSEILKLYIKVDSDEK